MKKIFQITLLALAICVLGSSCASKKRAPSRKSHVNCPAYGQKSSNYERLPY